MTAAAPIPHLAGRVEALEALGWPAADAEWLALVCLHSGVFTRAQYCHRFDVERYAALRFVRRLVEAGVAAEQPRPDLLPTSTRLCHVFGRGLYRALGVEHIRHRRFGTEGVVFRRLLSLDFVLERPDLPWLATEQEKVARFAELGIQPATLPQRVYGGAARRSRRYFHLKLPVAVDAGRAVFVYADPGADTTRQLAYWGEQHRPLWVRLRGDGMAVHVAVAGPFLAGAGALRGRPREVEGRSGVEAAKQRGTATPGRGGGGDRYRRPGGAGLLGRVHGGFEDRQHPSASLGRAWRRTDRQL